MTSMAVITPSYRPDLEGFRRLHESVLAFAGEDVMHHVIVPGIDAKLFKTIRSTRLTVWTYQEVIPTGLIATDRLAARMSRLPGLPSSINCAAVEARRPWRPVRGWVLQQIVKMGMVDHIDAELFVNIDSDVVLVRPLKAEDFVQAGVIRLYAVDEAITEDMKRHYRWCRTAHDLLGLPWQGDVSYPDHVGGVVSWDNGLLRRCVRRIEEVSGTPWAVAAARHLHFSEDILYGTYVRHFGSAMDHSYQRDTTRCHSYWSPTPMERAEAEKFIADFDDDHIAVHIQSNSDTDAEIEASVLNHLKELALR